MIERFLLISLPAPPDARRTGTALNALATDQELWKARSFPEANAARGRPRWEPTGEPFRRPVPQTRPPF
jgi:hypothetical protein